MVVVVVVLVVVVVVVVVVLLLLIAPADDPCRMPMYTGSCGSNPCKCATARCLDSPLVPS